MSLERVCDRCGKVIVPNSMAPDHPLVISGQDACSVECALVLLRGVYGRATGQYYPEHWNQAVLDAQFQLESK